MPQSDVAAVSSGQRPAIYCRGTGVQADEQRFVEYALETDDADGLYAYLKAQGYKAPR